MRILVTSGGTRTPIDEVRWIGNLSSGRFGAAIVKACLARGADTTHLVAKDAIRPDRVEVDLLAPLPSQWRRIQTEAGVVSEWGDRYRSESFVAVQDYADRLRALLQAEQFDAILLAAAVSDYEPIAQAGKIRSNLPELAVHMRRTLKVIASVRDWAPDAFLVGFKLLAGAPHEELVAAARDLARSARCDLVVANDMRQVLSGEHAIHLVREGAPVETFEWSDRPAERLVERVLAWVQGAS